MRKLFILFSFIFFSRSLAAQNENNHQSRELYKEKKVKSRLASFSFKGHVYSRYDEFNMEGQVVRRIYHSPDKNSSTMLLITYNNEGEVIREVTSKLPTIFSTNELNERVTLTEIYYDSLNRISGKDRTRDGVLRSQQMYSYDPLTISEYLYDSTQRKNTVVFEKPGLEKSSTFILIRGDSVLQSGEISYKNTFDKEGMLKKRKATLMLLVNTFGGKRAVKQETTIKYLYTENGLYKQIKLNGESFVKFTYEYYQ